MRLTRYTTSIQLLYMATKTLNIALPERLIKDIDRLVKQKYTSRSEYFRNLAIADLERRVDWENLLDIGNAKGKLLGIKSEQDVYRRIKG